jgi:hypothetical protein
MQDPNNCTICIPREVEQPKGGCARKKKISLRSIAPLDRLLSQAKQLDEITVRVRCEVPYPGVRGLDNDYDFTFTIDDVNKKTEVENDELSCPENSGYTIELFNRSNRRRLQDGGES